MFIGLDNNSWGYHSDDGNFFFSGNHNEYGYNDYGPSFTTGDTIGCCLNFRNNTVFFTKNGVNLGSHYFSILIFDYFKIRMLLIYYNLFNIF